MDHLWSPWRYSYVSQTDKSGVCIFCEKAKSDPARNRESWILYRGQLNFVILNLFPYTTGHALIVPYIHQADLSKLDAQTLQEMMKLAQAYQATLETVYHPDGYNLGMNLGQCAGAGVADHLHLHILPRWIGSANFMTAVGETRVLPEDLGTTYDKLAVRFRP